MNTTSKYQFSFERLEVYQISEGFVNSIFEITRTWPKEYLFDVTNQFRRAALSVPLNIAEGSARSKKDFQRFLDIARGSCLECVALTNIVYTAGLIDAEKVGQLKEVLTQISKMMSGLKSSLTTNHELKTNY